MTASDMVRSVARADVVALCLILTPAIGHAVTKRQPQLGGHRRFHEKCRVGQPSDSVSSRPCQCLFALGKATSLPALPYLISTSSVSLRGLTVRILPSARPPAMRIALSNSAGGFVPCQCVFFRARARISFSCMWRVTSSPAQGFVPSSASARTVRVWHSGCCENRLGFERSAFPRSQAFVDDFAVRRKNQVP